MVRSFSKPIKRSISLFSCNFAFILWLTFIEISFAIHWFSISRRIQTKYIYATNIFHRGSLFLKLLQFCIIWLLINLQLLSYIYSTTLIWKTIFISYTTKFCFTFKYITFIIPLICVCCPRKLQNYFIILFFKKYLDTFS